MVMVKGKEYQAVHPRAHEVDDAVGGDLRP
jgi:hypothetical protein